MCKLLLWEDGSITQRFDGLPLFVGKCVYFEYKWLLETIHGCITFRCGYEKILMKSIEESLDLWLPAFLLNGIQ